MNRRLKMLLKKFLLTILIASALSGCQKKEAESSIAFSEIQNKLISKANFENTKTEDMKEINTAQRYGISPDDIEDGFAYSTENESSDKIILVNTKGGASIENVEKALANEVSGLITSWEDNAAESSKLKEHVLKTKENYVILIISDDSAKIEDEFDNILNS